MDVENSSSDSTPESSNPYVLWAALAIAVAAVLFAALVISRVASPLIGLIAPPEPPRFEPSTLMEHRVPLEGIDEWIYVTSTSSCEVYEWYSRQADYCRTMSDSPCSANAEPSDSTREVEVGRCFGSERFGDFVAEWEVSVYDGYTGEGGRTRFFTTREINWMTER